MEIVNSKSNWLREKHSSDLEEIIKLKADWHITSLEAFELLKYNKSVNKLHDAVVRNLPSMVVGTARETAHIAETAERIIQRYVVAYLDVLSKDHKEFTRVAFLNTPFHEFRTSGYRLGRAIRYGLGLNNSYFDIDYSDLVAQVYMREQKTSREDSFKKSIRNNIDQYLVSAISVSAVTTNPFKDELGKDNLEYMKKFDEWLNNHVQDSSEFKLPTSNNLTEGEYQVLINRVFGTDPFIRAERDGVLTRLETERIVALTEVLRYRDSGKSLAESYEFALDKVQKEHEDEVGALMLEQSGVKKTDKSDLDRAAIVRETAYTLGALRKNKKWLERSSYN